MTTAEHDSHAGSALVSAHFVNNVLAAAASYIEEDPDLARDILAELGQFLAYRLRDRPAPASAAQELAHTATYLRLQQARFPDRITAVLPEEGSGPAGVRMPPGTIQAPVSAALDAHLREHAGAVALTLREASGGLELVLAGADGGPQQTIAIPLMRNEGAMP